MYVKSYTSRTKTLHYMGHYYIFSSVVSYKNNVDTFFYISFFEKFRNNFDMLTVRSVSSIGFRISRWFPMSQTSFPSNSLLQSITCPHFLVFIDINPFPLQLVNRYIFIVIDQKKALPPTPKNGFLGFELQYCPYAALLDRLLRFQSSKTLLVFGLVKFMRLPTLHWVSLLLLKPSINRLYGINIPQFAFCDEEYILLNFIWRLRNWVLFYFHPEPIGSRLQFLLQLPASISHAVLYHLHQNIHRARVLFMSSERTIILTIQFIFLLFVSNAITIWNPIRIYMIIHCIPIFFYLEQIFVIQLELVRIKPFRTPCVPIT